MQRLLDIEPPNLGELRLTLHRRLQQLEAERDRIASAIEETERRLGVLDEVWSWALPEAQAQPVQPANVGQAGVVVEPRLVNGDGRLLGLGLADAIVYLRRENPEITKQGVRERLEGIGYRFPSQGPNIRRGIHTAWLYANRRLQAQ